MQTYRLKAKVCSLAITFCVLYTLSCILEEFAWGLEGLEEGGGELSGVVDRELALQS